MPTGVLDDPLLRIDIGRRCLDDLCSGHGKILSGILVGNRVNKVCFVHTGDNKSLRILIGRSRYLGNRVLIDRRAFDLHIEFAAERRVHGINTVA